MSLAQLPPLDFDSGGLRISLFPRSDSPPLFAPDPVSGEPAIADSRKSNEAEIPVPQRKRPQIPDHERYDGDGHDVDRDGPLGLKHGDQRPPTERGYSISSDGASDKHGDKQLRHGHEENDPFGDQASDVTGLSEPENNKPQSKVVQTIPIHPIPSMQDAFAESLHEVTMGGPVTKPKLRSMDAKARRERLLEQEKDSEPFDQLWRYRPGQKQHEVLKLLAQISFGVYLLLNGMANSNSQVVTILQGHIDEVDEFLEVALEDLAQATIDLNGRIDYLKLPMSNMQVFEELLEDRNFRVEILEGNEKIEHILARTNMALKQWDDDIDAGLVCSADFTKWLRQQDSASWKTDRPEVMDIFDAMNGNAEGWQNAFEEMNCRAQEMNNLIIKLMTIVAEMEKKAGEISRKTWAQIPPFTVPAKIGDKSSISSPQSHQSNPRSQGSVRSGTFSTFSAQKADHHPIDDDSLLEYPLPGGTPLLPPPRISARAAPRPSSSSSSAKRQNGVTFAPMSPPRSVDRTEGSSIQDKAVAEEESLYILQPRTYTPQPAKPAVSQATQQSPRTQLSPKSGDVSSDQKGLQKQTSLRQRVSQRGKAPVSIQIPPRNFAEGTAVHRQSPSFATPRTGGSMAHDSAYGSDSEHQPQHRQIPRMASHSDLSAPVRPPLMPSPRSDHQYYRPVQASPHSPLQQRPHTSGTGAAAAPRHQSASYTPQHVRNQPSRLGGMSMLSNVTNAQDDARTIATQRTARGTDRTLKKKKSAFGWLKKAFSMDDEERAAYEARKAMQVDPQYFDDKSPKFLDGKRIR
ncbi:hypothetical protein NLU13_1114 [Sarocladium strictum]|uniref:Uncharacterized protein n=1 Tax=Sarocladium strictum TaxID=5046 RepID=A0AA39GSA3_SARSR|nr:hypothetical protein NLU13_1114 [Sarocladium strictum]